MSTLFNGLYTVFGNSDKKMLFFGGFFWLLFFGSTKLCTNETMHTQNGGAFGAFFLGAFKFISITGISKLK